MNEILETLGLLAEVMQGDALLMLANTVTWLDPLWEMGDEDVFEDGDGVGMALSITRSAFPDIYAGSVERIRSGASEKDLDRYICGEISQQGIPLDSLEFMGYGIPLIACGVELAEPELYQMRPDLIPVLNLFGIDPVTAHYEVQVPDCAYTAGRMLAASLVKQDDKHLKQVGWALGWLFSCTGNTLLDFDEDALAEVQPLSWEVDDLNFAVDLIEEADEMMLDVNAGLKWLEADRQLFDNLQENIQRIYQAIAKQKGKPDDPRIRLEWSPVVAGSDGATVADSELLQLRDYAA